MNKILFAPLALALAAALPAHAATPINETRPLAADGSVSIDNVKGRIVVRTWAQPQVKIGGSLGAGVEKLEIDGDGKSLHIEVKYPRNDNGFRLWGDTGRAEPTVLEVTVPQRASLDIDSVSADVDVQQAAGRRLSVESVSGQVSVTASSPGEAKIESVSGDILLRMTTPSAHVESVSGDVDLQGGLTGEVHLETVSGNAKLVARSLRQLEMSTVSGDLNVQTALTPDATVKSESVSGDLTLALPRDTGAQLHVETFSGDIDSPVGQVEREEAGPGRSLDVRLGDGHGRIDLESFSGDVNLKLQ